MIRPSSIVFIPVLILCVFGAMERNAAWIAESSVWGDAANKSPEKARARNNYGGVLLKEGRAVEAKPEFLAVVKLAPGFFEAYNNLGLIYADEGAYNEAVRSFTRALMIDYYNYSIHYNVALVHDAEGKKKEAVFHYERFLELLPAGIEIERAERAGVRIRELGNGTAAGISGR